MRTEDDLRLALRVLERETPDAETVLRHVAERTSARTAGRGRRPGRRLIAGASAAAAVIAIAVAAALVATRPGGHGRASAQDALRSVPRYYMALVPVSSNEFGAYYAVVRDALTGKTLATIRPPKPYVTFVGVTGAADDRTFVLTAQSTLAGSLTSRNKFYYVRFNPADNAVTLTLLALPGLPFSNYLSGSPALSPDGTRLAVASQEGPAQIAVYSLPSGAVRVWVASDRSASAFSTDVVDLLSWSSTGILAFGWNGPPAGEYLLNTNSTGGSLLAHSRPPLCLPSQSLLSSYYGYLTPDGTKIIVPLLPAAVPPGQRPACPQTPSSPGTGQASPGTGQASPGTSQASPGTSQPSPGTGPAFFPKFEEFSATTGQAIGVIYTSPSSGQDQGGEVFWSNASGSVLVLTGVVRRGPKWQVVYGVLSGGRFTPIPGAPSSVTLLAF